MTHFGIICPPGVGHLNPISAVGHELVQRGHSVTLFGVPDVRSRAEAAGLNFAVIGAEKFPQGSLAKSHQKIGESDGIVALIYLIDQFRQGTELILKEVPPGCKKLGIDVLLIDQTNLEGATIAEYLNLPFITICNALMLNPEPTIPPALTPWNYDLSWWAQWRNQIGTELLRLAGTPVRLLVEDYRQKWGLPRLTSDEPLNLWSKLAIISQQTPSFEFPRQKLPAYFHFTGPLVNSQARKPIEFPWTRLTDKPLIYASLGTLQNRLFWVFLLIAYACVELNVQLVISLGNASSPKEIGYLPGNPIIVKVAPQLELLEKASLCITHAGMNTVLEALSNGVPMIAIPIANDQQGVAARIAWTKTGVVIPLEDCSISQLSTAIKLVLNNDDYRQNVLRLKSEIEKTGGISKAAEIIEKATATRSPVLAS